MMKTKAFLNRLENRPTPGGFISEDVIELSTRQCIRDSLDLI
jgi:hypothetical protein